MATPSQVRSVLLRLTQRASRDIRAVAAASPKEPEALRAALFAAAPLVINDYMDGSAALALDWYDDLRDASKTRERFTPRPLVLVTDADLDAVVADVTKSLYEIEQGLSKELDEAIAKSVLLLEEQAERLVAESFRDTITGNTEADPAAAGWRRYARPEACKFCKMLAARGAVYTEKTARFAAHGAVMGGSRKGGNCMCIAGPEFGKSFVEATPTQYMASQKTRTKAQRAQLRDYLNHNFPDAPG